MPYTKKQCGYFATNPNNRPKDWAEKCSNKKKTKKTTKRKR